MANYIVRQQFISKNEWVRWIELDKKLKEDYVDCYRLLPAKSSQMVLKQLDLSWKSFFASIKNWKKNKSKYLGRPKLPRYKDKDGFNKVVLTNQQAKIKDGKIEFLLSLTKDLKFKPLKTKISNDARLKQIEVLYRENRIEFLVNYEISEIELQEKQGLNRKTGEIYELKPDSAMSIDLGINNFATVSNSIDKDFFILEGKGLKALNQWTNKVNAKMQSKNSKKRLNLWLKRENKIRHTFHHYTNYVINKCLEKGIKNIIVGYNSEWKQKVNLGRKTNQSFVQIPYLKFLQILEYKCKLANLNFETINEAYTSKCSFLDSEDPRKHTEYLGKRVKRGLFKSAKGLLINADLNASLNILRKYLGKVFQPNSVEGFVISPYRVRLG